MFEDLDSKIARGAILSKDLIHDDRGESATSHHQLQGKTQALKHTIVFEATVNAETDRRFRCQWSLCRPPYTIKSCTERWEISH